MSRRARFRKKMNVASVAKDRHTPAFAPQMAISYPVWNDQPRDMDWIKKHYGPPRTMGVSDDVFMAMDAQLENAGVYTLLQHSLQHGQSVYPEFVGYGALQGMSQNGLIRACIETVCDDMTRNWVTLKGGDTKDDEKSVVEEITASLHSLNIQNSIHHACELVGYEGGAFIYIDTGATTEEIEKPLNISPYSAELQPGKPLRFVVVDPINVFPGDYNSLYPLRKDYFNPVWWYVLGQKVHASRMIRLVANEVPILLKPAYNFLGLSQAQILWDYVLHFQECRAAEARLLTKFSMTVFKTKLMDTILSGGGVEQLDTRIRFMTQTMNNDGVLVVDNEREDVVKLETPLSGVTDIVRQALEFLAALNRTPAVKLLGISPSGFNATGESDIRNYYDHVASQQEKIIRNALETILRCVQLHLYGAIDKNITFDFNPLGQEDNAALAMQQKTRADTVAVYLDRDIISVEEARKAIAEDPDSGFYGIDPDDIPEGNPMPTGMEEMTPYGGGMEPGKNNDVDDVDKAGAVYDAALLGEDDEEWRTAKNGKHFEVDTETGKITKGNLGQKDWDSPAKQDARRDKVEDAMREIANGKPEATVPALRNDLEQYGGTNDVTIIRGNEKKGLLHIEKRHGSSCVAPVLEAVANGKIARFINGNKTVHLEKDGYRAVLSLEEHGKKKTWLLTGYDIVRDGKNITGDNGKVSARHASTHAGPILSRPDMGAVSSFAQRIEQILAMSITKKDEEH